MYTGTNQRKTEYIRKENRKKGGMRMPRVYLSPSLQEYNLYVNGGTEEEITNLIADAMEPYLLASGIEFTRNRPEMSLGEAIAASNEGNYDLHFAIHSNAAPESLAGKLQGVDAYYFYNSLYGREMADIVTENMKQVYPDGEKVQSVATATLRELRRTNAPAVLVEVGYHDNIEDAQWIKENIDQIAKALAKSIADYFGVPFRQPQV
jgi:N-acetylmuramoyl-L-alanine amidase